MGRRKKIDITQENGHTTISGTAEDITNALKSATAPLTKKPIEIKGAALKDMFCNYSYDHTVAANIINSVSIKSEVPVHDDLINAFNNLNGHLVVICEEIEDADAYGSLEEMISDNDHSEKFKKYSVTSFKMEGEEESPAVTLSGTKRLTTGKHIKLETPKINLDQEYLFASELSIAIADVIDEVERYMTGKRAPDRQQELFPQEAEFEENE